MINSRPILVVEDDHAIRLAVQEFLEMEGFTVLTASNGVEGIAALESLAKGSPLPGLILLDLMMPLIEPEEFMRRKNALPGGIAQIPVLAFSADLAIEKRAEQIGAQGTIRKPIDLDPFLKTISKYLQC